MEIGDGCGGIRAVLGFTKVANARPVILELVVDRTDIGVKPAEVQ